MLIRFGFVAMSMILEHASPSKAVTLKTYRTLAEKDPDAALEKVRRTARENLTNSLRVLKHCTANRVSVYRFSSRLIPLATHPELSHWDYIGELSPQFVELGSYIRENGLRVTFHPDHYTLLNSPDEGIFQSSIVDLAHHSRMLNAMRLGDQAKLIIHVGGGYQDKKESMERFLDNWARVPNGIARRITLENDDKTFTARETLYLCEKLQLPMVLDLHHYHCNHEEDSTLEEIIPRFLATWRETGLPPKIHLSSPKCDTDIRSHHDYIDTAAVFPDLQKLCAHDTDIDAMVEAKQKDKAMFCLVEELGRLAGVSQCAGARVEIKTVN